MVSNEAPQRLHRIDCCRGFAALLIVFFHAYCIFGAPQYFRNGHLKATFESLSRGVDFFFVLSGFVITFVHWRDVGHAGCIRRYFTKRFIRVFPIYWVVATPLLIKGLLLPSESSPLSLIGRLELAVTSFLLLPSTTWPVPIVAWTLKHEILFYLLFSAFLLKPVIGSVGLAGWGVLCVVHSAIGSDSHYWTDFLFNAYNLEFLGGMLCGLFVRTNRVSAPRLWIIFGILGFALAAHSYKRVSASPWTVSPTSLLQVIHFGAASAAIVLGLSQLDLDAPDVAPKVFELLGAASYSIYLAHFQIIFLIGRVLKNSDGLPIIDSSLAFYISAVAGVLGGIVLHLLIEKPLLGLLRRPRAKPIQHVGAG